MIDYLIGCQSQQGWYPLSSLCKQIYEEVRDWFQTKWSREINLGKLSTGCFLCCASKQYWLGHCGETLPSFVERKQRETNTLDREREENMQSQTDWLQTIVFSKLFCGYE